MVRARQAWRALRPRRGRPRLAAALQYLGAKIAFTRVPEPVEFRE